MTGYGSASGEASGTSLAVEIRSVNQRFFDLKLSVPRDYGPWEAELRRLVGEHIDRGRVEVHVARSWAGRSSEISVQVEQARAWLGAWRSLQSELELGGEITIAHFLGRNDLFTAAERRSDPAAEIEAVKALVGEALAAHRAEREREGGHLEEDMRARCASLAGIVERIRGRAAGAVERLHKRLTERVGELLAGSIDPERLVHETAVMADRSDITEELVRLGSHIPALEGLVAADGSVAKRIDFVLQEINREFNTIGSKAGDLEITNLVVEAKAEVEKLREQVQNVE
jgi:uncharacterized protein (TIGR00255 family)